ncbi:MAG TPA: hypothetical protein VFP87_08630, partial [Chitinophagaceae bacterium]|nr:hypothetical protein [Chitinophagaceae bacterium]
VGAFYDVEKDAASFNGKHTILFTDFDQREYKEEFTYTPFKLKTKISPQFNRGDLLLEFTGLEDDDHLRVIIADTSFISRDIHEIDTIKNNRVLITADKLKAVVNGPIVLLLSKETERPIQNGTSAAGKISITYGMQREFVLRDSP